MTATAPLPPTVIARMEEIGFKVTHVYWLTETYGPSVVCARQEDWDSIDPTQQAVMKERQVVNYPGLEGLMVALPESTKDACRGGWFHSWDLGVMHPDGYIELKDRTKDIIVSGGENISSVEIENTLYRHPEVLEAGVVTQPDEHWGETPCAFVDLKEGSRVSEEDLIEFCKNHLAGFKITKTMIFQELPKTSTGKIRKNLLREQARDLWTSHL